MSSWGAGGNDKTVPTWLNAQERANTYATSKGWVYKNPYTGIEEVLVATKSLQNKLANAAVTSIYFDRLSRANSVPANVFVTFTESVTVSGSPNVMVTSANNGTLRAVYGSGNNTTKLRFQVTTPANNDVLTLSTIALQFNGGSIFDNAGGAIASTSLTPASKPSLNTNVRMVIVAT